jgi:hypothetical protein
MPCMPFLSLTLNTRNCKLMIQINTTSQDHVIPDLLNPGNQTFSTLVTIPIVNSQNCTLKYEVPHNNQGKLYSNQDFSLMGRPRDRPFSSHCSLSFLLLFSFFYFILFYFFFFVSFNLLNLCIVLYYITFINF